MKIFKAILIIIEFLGLIYLIGYVIYTLFGHNGLVNYETVLIIIVLCGLTGSLSGN